MRGHFHLASACFIRDAYVSCPTHLVSVIHACVTQAAWPRLLSVSTKIPRLAAWDVCFDMSCIILWLRCTQLIPNWYIFTGELTQICC